ncbi:MAG: PilN domain-containing protein [Oceanospirillaceae bacterium]
MKQTINLLPAKPIKVKNWLAFNCFLAMLTITSTVCLVAAATYWQYANGLAFEYQQRTTTNLNVQNSMSALSSQLESRQAPTQLSNQVAQLGQQVIAMQQMLAASAQVHIKQNDDFLDAFLALQRSMPDDAQLESFKFSSGQYLDEVAGTIALPADIARLLANLKNNGLLKHQQIASVSTQNSGDVYSFTLSAVRRKVDR